MLNKKIIVIFVACLLLLPCSIAIPVGAIGDYDRTSADIRQNTMWTADNGPYVFEDTDIFVWIGAELAIAPGTVIKLKNSSIMVEGSMRAIGREGEEIVFTSFNDSSIGGDSNGPAADEPMAGDWGRIMVADGASMQFDHARIYYGGQIDIQIVKSFIRPSRALAFSVTAAVLDFQSARGEINHSEIAHNLAGINSFDSELTVAESRLFDNGEGAMFCPAGRQVSAVGNWWGSDSGPWHETINPEGRGEKIFGNILFEPWVEERDLKKTPVIIVPGIMGSYLRKNEPGQPEVWPNLDGMIFSPSDDFLDDLKMNEAGWSNMNNIIPGEVIKKISVLGLAEQDMFGGLIEHLESAGYKENTDLFTFGYDWRNFINWTASGGGGLHPLAKSLKQRVEEIKAQTGAAKVDIIAHSLGGLIVKDYIKRNLGGSVGKFIDIGTPHYGAPKAYKILMYGDNMGLSLGQVDFLNPEKIKLISQNIPSVYELLPSAHYFNNNLLYPADNPDKAYFVYDMHDYDRNGIKGRLDFAASFEFLKNTGRNSALTDESSSLHEFMDDFEPGHYGVEGFNIIGEGVPTLGQVIIMNKKLSGKYEYGLRFINGDGTVPARSASGMAAADSCNFSVCGTEHASLASASGVKELTGAILTSKLDIFNMQIFPNLKENYNTCFFSGTVISFHSPIELHADADKGGHVGPNENGDIEREIPGAQYEIIDDNKFVFLPTGDNYEIHGQATASGTFDVRVQKIENSEIVKTEVFYDLPLESANTLARIVVKDAENGNHLVELDMNGDEEYELNYGPEKVFAGEENIDSLPPEIEIMFPINGSFFSRGDAFDLSYTAQDAESDVASSSAIITPVKIENKQDFLPFGGLVLLAKDPGAGDSTLDFFRYPLGEYSLVVASEDGAGNTASSAVGFTIGATIESAIKDANRAEKEGLILDQKAGEKIIRGLESVKEIMDKHGKRMEVRDEKILTALEKCQKSAKPEKCRAQIEKISTRISVKLDKLHEAWVDLKLRALEVQIDYFFAKKWINNVGHDIIKSDIDWLIKK